jgi:hypothetical protein
MQFTNQSQCLSLIIKLLLMYRQMYVWNSCKSALFKNVFHQSKSRQPYHIVIFFRKQIIVPCFLLLYCMWDLMVNMLIFLSQPRNWLLYIVKQSAIQITQCFQWTCSNQPFKLHNIFNELTKHREINYCLVKELRQFKQHHLTSLSSSQFWKLAI